MVEAEPPSGTAWLSPVAALLAAPPEADEATLARIFAAALMSQKLCLSAQVILGKSAEETHDPALLRLPLRHGDEFLGELQLTSPTAGANDALPTLTRTLVAALIACRTRRASLVAGEELAQLVRVIEQSPVSVLITDLAGNIEYCNTCFTETTGYSRDELLGQNPRLLKSGHTPDSLYKSLWTALASGQEWRGEILNKRKDGTLFWERELIVPLRDGNSHPIRYVAIKEDVSALRKAEETLRLHERALESISNGVMITSSTHLDHPIVYINQAFERITGYTSAQVVGKNARFLVREDTEQMGLNEIRAALRQHREGSAVLRNYRQDGSLFWNELHLAPVRDEAGKLTTHFVSIVNDVTERMAYEEQLEYQATHDVLTGLANRSLLADRIQSGMAVARRDNTQLAVLLLDLDRFKVANDGLGHACGDALLREVSRRLNGCIRDTDTAARLGGDEFVIVLTDIHDADSVAMAAQKVLRTVAQPVLLEGQTLHVTASIGIALYPRDGEQPDLLLRNADLAMYRVKEHGRNNYRFYLPEMNNMALTRLDMEGNLRRALEKGELVVYYQPKLDIKTGCITGAEALVRWPHPHIGLIGPNEFIPLAEETGLILRLGEFVLETVCRQQAEWRKAGLPELPVAINISARQFRQEDLADIIAARLRAYDLNGAHLDIELTESVVMLDADTTLNQLRQIHDLGIRIALDDFGTGYSSLSYLKRFPIDCLKIDRSFVRDITCNADDAAIANAVIAMAHSLGLEVVAEGVETAAQLSHLAQEGCEAYQGYLFSRPVPVDQFTRLLREGRSLSLDEALSASP